MKIHSFIILSIFKLSLSKSAFKKDHDSKSIEGDTLIDKILSADKFNELADKIVDKALAKFNNKKSSLGLSTENVKKNSTPEFKSNKEKVSIKTKKKDRKHKSTTKIDVDAVLQKKALPLGDLSFRYEHFTKNITSTTSEKPVAKINYDYKVIPTNAKVENINVNSVKHEDSSKGKDESDEKTTSEKDDDSKSKEQPNSNKNKQTDLSSENLRFNVKPQMIQPQSGENQFGNSKTIHWNENEKDEDDSKESAKKTTDGKKEITEVASEIFNRADDGIQQVNDDDSQSDALQNAGDEEMKERKRIVRREGDKVFTLNESPDYAEYHEIVAKLKKVNHHSQKYL